MYTQLVWVIALGYLIFADLPNYGTLAGAAIVALTASGYCCALTAGELLKLQKQRLLKRIERGLEAGKSVQEVMRDIDHG